MDLSFTPADRAFRETVRAFLAEPLPRALCERVRRGRELDKPARTAWQKALHDRGWAGINWPLEHGGTGWTSVQKHIFWEELCEADAPGISPFGLAMVAPIIMAFGSEAQKHRFLPPILRSDVWWCQGYSEPGAGSDLASLKTRAVRDGDDYVVNGAKTWTTDAHLADWIFCLVRTDFSAKKHDGISFILFDMTSKGVSTKPILLISGKSPFCETFFDNVRVPRSHVVGTVNRGWDVAKYLLQHERSMISEVGERRGARPMGQVAANSIGVDEHGQLDDPMLRGQIAAFDVDEAAMACAAERAVDLAKAGQGHPAYSSALKYYGTELNKRRYEILMSAGGVDALEWESERSREGLTARTWLRTKANSIEGGTSEVMLGIVAKRILDLPGA